MAKRKYLGGTEQVDLLSVLAAAADPPSSGGGALAQILRTAPIAPLLLAGR